MKVQVIKINSLADLEKAIKDQIECVCDDPACPYKKSETGKDKKPETDKAENSTPKDMKLIPSLNNVADAGEILQLACHGRSYNAGWWHDPQTGEKLNRNVPEMLCLIHSEISEAMEGYRKDLMDDKLPHRKMIEVELADAAIRIFDLAGGLGFDLGAAIAEKMDFNAKRADHKPEARLAEGGKKF